MLTGNADLCRLQAACARLRRQPQIAEHWDALARHYDLAEQISAFLAWNALRLQPPEAFTDASNQASTRLAAIPAAEIEELATWRRNRKRRRREAARRTSR
jgi:hypothetical protein